MVDKNAANLASFQNVFENAQIHLCIFHVQQIFQREITTSKRSIDDETKKDALTILTNMIYCRSEHEYDQLYQQLEALGSESVMNYFNENWHVEHIRQMWIGYHVNKRTHFQNRTNNRLESFNQKLKAIISSYAPLKVFFKDLFVLITSMSTERRTKAINMTQKQPKRQPDEPEHTYKYRCFFNSICIQLCFTATKPFSNIQFYSYGRVFSTYCKR